MKKFAQLEHVGDIRQKGMMVRIELVEDKETKKPYPREDNVGHRVIPGGQKKRPDAPSPGQCNRADVGAVNDYSGTGPGT